MTCENAGEIKALISGLQSKGGEVFNLCNI